MVQIFYFSWSSLSPHSVFNRNNVCVCVFCCVPLKNIEDLLGFSGAWEALGTPGNTVPHMCDPINLPRGIGCTGGDVGRIEGVVLF